MTTRTNYMARSAHRFLGSDRDHLSPAMADPFELDESDIWGGPVAGSYSSSVAALSGSPELMRHQQQQPPMTRIGGSRKAAAARGTPSSLPVNIPDWSKILREESREERRRKEFDPYGSDDSGGDEDQVDDYYGGGGIRVPPHELVARKRMASFSVHEGVGRTLKGRDLSRVRNAIWAKTGFQD